MKKFYLWALALIAAICCSFNASAYSVNVSWNEAGTIRLYNGTVNPENEIDVTGLTSYTVVYTSSARIYVTPAEGYVFEKIVEPGVTNPKTSFSVNENWGQFYMKFLTSTQNGKDMVITTKPLVRSASMTVNVINGADKIGGYVVGLSQPLNLHDGQNTINFNPDLETGLYITCEDGVSSFYQVKLNGTDVPKNAYFARYQINGIKNGDQLTIQVYEGSVPVEEKVTVTLEYAEGIEDCLYSIRNWTTSKFITPVNNQFEILKGQDIGFNFKSTTDGFNISEILVNGVSGSTITGAKYTSTSDIVSLRFAVNEDITLKVEGSPATYANIPMTAYVMNPQGVIITSGKYGEGEEVDMNGSALTSSVTLPSQTHTDTEGNITYITPSFTLTPENAKEIHFTVQDRKFYNAYVAPKPGWYIATVQNAKKEEISIADKEYDQNFYVVALPLPNNMTATVNVELPENVFSNLRFKSNDVLAGNWDNPSASYTLKNNTSNTISYTEGYQTPFTLASLTVASTFNCMVDNRVLAVADPETAIAYSLDLVNGSVVNVGTTNYAANAYTVTLSGKDGKSATYTYSDLNRTGENGYKLLSGTPISVRPVSDDCMLTVNGTVVYSPKNNINLLTDGAYTFNLDAATTIAAASDAQFVKITKTNPVDGQLVSQFETLTVTLPALENPEHMFYFDEAAMNTVKVTPASGRAIEATSIEPSMDDSGNTQYIITFETIDEIGTYTITIPAGFFFEVAWSDAEENFVAVNNGASTEAFSSTFTVDPSAPAFHLIPAQNSTVSDLSKFRIVFPGANMAEFVESSQITLVGVDFTAVAGQVSTVAGADHPTYDIMFGTTPSVAGQYTLNLPEGAFSINGWKDSEKYAAVYTFKPIYTLTPASGSTIEELVFTISFPEASQVTFSGSAYDVSLAAGEKWAAPKMEVTEVSNAAVPTFTIALPAEAQKAPYGALTLSISEGVFTVDGADSPYISASYTYEGSVEVTYQSDPAGDYIVIPAEQWGMVMWTFLFDESTTLQNVLDQISGASVTVNGNAADYMVMAESNMLMMGLASKEGLNDGDVLRVQIPAGAFSVSGSESPAIDRSWTLVAPKSYTWTTNPANGSIVNNLSEITLTFVEEATGLQPTAATVAEYSTTVSVMHDYSEVTKADIAWVKGGEFKVTLKQTVTAAGNYTIRINSGAFQFDGCQNYDEFISLNFTVDPNATGITDIRVNGSDKVNAVSINGRMIINADAKSLPAGIYIINGKKTIIK